MKKAKDKIILDELVNGKLPLHVTKSIGKMQVSVEDLSRWSNSRPAIYIAIKDKVLVFEFRLQVSIKKLLSITGAVVGVILLVVEFFTDYYPLIKTWLSNV